MTKPILHSGFSNWTAVTTGILNIFLPSSLSYNQGGYKEMSSILVDLTFRFLKLNCSDYRYFTNFSTIFIELQPGGYKEMSSIFADQ